MSVISDQGCDRCGIHVRAYARLDTRDGSLYFCHHHYSLYSIMACSAFGEWAWTVTVTVNVGELGGHA